MLTRLLILLLNSTVMSLQEIARSFGDLLSSKRQHEDAAIMYVKGESWDLALNSYKACNHWQQVFCMTAQLNYTAEQESEIARDVAGKAIHLLTLLNSNTCR